jgi:uncharacterized protein YkwD
MVLAGGGYVVHGHGSGSAIENSLAGGVDAVPQPIGLAALAAQVPAPAATPGGAVSATSPPTRPKPSASTVKPRPSTSKPPKVVSKPSHTVPPASGSVVDQLLAQINTLRANNNLPPYKILSGLLASAHKHNLFMVGTCGMQHQCPGEASLGDRISAQGVSWTMCGENIGWSGPHPDKTSAIVAAAEGLTTAMYNEKPPDDGHRQNLLSSKFHHIGIDVVRDSSGKVWVTQDFSS